MSHTGKSSQNGDGAGMPTTADQYDNQTSVAMQDIARIWIRCTEGLTTPRVHGFRTTRKMISADPAEIATASSEKRTYDAEQKPTSRTNGRTREFHGHSFGFRVSASSSTDIGSAWGRRSKMEGNSRAPRAAVHRKKRTGKWEAEAALERM
jgi:hypothetical protein